VSGGALITALGREGKGRGKPGRRAGGAGARRPAQPGEKGGAGRLGMTPIGGPHLSAARERGRGGERWRACGISGPGE
jgi:hypothetical protein